MILQIAFPLAKAVSIVISVTFSLVAVLLLTLVVLSILHIKKLTAEEIKFL